VSTNANASRAFAEWATLFSERVFVILKVYADESDTAGQAKKRGAPEFSVIGAYIAPVEAWNKFNGMWRTVLDSYGVRNFHFREFHSKEHTAIKGSEYYGWSPEKRDRFFYDLAMVSCDDLVPLGGGYPVQIHKEKSGPGDPYKHLFMRFFGDVQVALNSHWPEFSEKVLFVFDNTNSRQWRDAAFDMRSSFAFQDARFGGLTFEDDTDPKHLGLQAADFLAAIYRQAAEVALKTGGLAKQRIIDLIMFRNLRQPGHPFGPSNMNRLAFQLTVNLFRAHEKQKKREWKSQGLKNKVYYPFDEFPFEKYGIKRMQK
jgi:hypothetical protein